MDRWRAPHGTHKGRLIRPIYRHQRACRRILSSIMMSYYATQAAQMTQPAQMSAPVLSSIYAIAHITRRYVTEQSQIRVIDRLYRLPRRIQLHQSKLMIAAACRHAIHLLPWLLKCYGLAEEPWLLAEPHAS